MNRQKRTLFIAALALMAGTAGLLAQLRSHQKLGEPGVKTHPIPNSNRLQVDLPETVLDFGSEAMEAEAVTLQTLPADTSFGQRRYKAADGFGILMQVVLMGSDRTSIHKPQFCLEGQDWHIDDAASAVTSVTVEEPCRYELPVVKLVANKNVMINGERRVARGIYVYWFVADDSLSASMLGMERMLHMGWRLLRTGILQRWAYVSCFAVCDPGQEDATFERMKHFIAASVPSFQLIPRPSTAAVSAGN